MLLELKSPVVGPNGVMGRKGETVDSACLGISEAEAQKIVARKQAKAVPEAGPTS